MKLRQKDIVSRIDLSKNQRVKTVIVLILLQLGFAFLIYRLFFLQVVQGDELRDQAENQYYREIRVAAKRGNIYDRNMQPLAVKTNSYSLFADPQMVKDPESVARTLSPILDIPETELTYKLESKGRFVWLKRQMSDQLAHKIGDFNIKGLMFREEEKRFYPKGSLASHIIGFVGLDNVGLDGIEKAYDSYMRGNFREMASQKDCKGRNLTPQRIGYEEPSKGYDIVLSVDEVIQHIAEKEIRRACVKQRSVSGSVIIMNPKTGEILAMANYPTYDLNKAFSTGDELKRNRAIRDLYEPGSAFKIITASAAINENMVTLEERINCENGSYNFDGFVIHDTGMHGDLTFSEVVEMSSNIGIVKVANRLGEDLLYNYIEKFGLTSHTGVELSDRDGLVRTPQEWTRRSMTSIPFGQEIAVTPLQMLCATNAIANNGVIMKPFIVRAILDNQNPRVKSSPKISANPISSRTAGIMKQILIRAVENGTGKKAAIQNCLVGGKTGTAQKASEEGGYLPDKYVSLFTGFIMARDLMLSMIVVVNEPQGEHSGSLVACPVFSNIGTQVMQYLSVGQRAYVEAR
jgi:cell division protein FtsI (penicillin-binding protein 3)